jgi:hypothetical protein
VSRGQQDEPVVDPDLGTLLREAKRLNAEQQEALTRPRARIAQLEQTA